MNRQPHKLPIIARLYDADLSGPEYTVARAMVNLSKDGITLVGHSRRRIAAASGYKTTKTIQRHQQSLVAKGVLEIEPQTRFHKEKDRPEHLPHTYRFRHHGRAPQPGTAPAAGRSPAPQSTATSSTQPRARQRGIYEIPPIYNRAVWDMWEMRCENKGVTINDEWRRRMVRKLRAYGTAQMQNEVLKQSADNRWIDLYPLEFVTEVTARNQVIIKPAQPALPDPQTQPVAAPPIQPPAVWQNPREVWESMSDTWKHNNPWSETAITSSPPTTADPRFCNRRPRNGPPPDIWTKIDMEKQ